MTDYYDKSKHVSTLHEHSVPSCSSLFTIKVPIPPLPPPSLVAVDEEEEEEEDAVESVVAQS